MIPLGWARGDKRWWYGAIACTFILLCYAVLVVTKPISQDEGVFLAIGKYLNQGQVLYQDVFDHKPPGIHFLYAGLFAVFGSSLWVIKIALLASTLGAALIIKKVSEALKPETGWMTAVIFLFLMTQFEGYYLIAEPFMLLPLLAAIWVMLTKQHQAWMFMAGLFLGVTVLFKQTAVLSVLPVLALGLITSKSRWVWLGLGFVSPLILTAKYLWAYSLFRQAWHQVVTLTLTSYPHEPLSFVLQSLQQNFLWTLPIWVLLGLAWWPNLKHKKFLWGVFLLPWPILFFRHYPHYWVQVLPWAAILVAATLSDIRVRSVSLATMIFCVAIAGGKVGQDAGGNWQKLTAQLAAAAELNADFRLDESDHQARLLAENQFTAFYFLLPLRPLNTYLYLTEITDAEQAQRKTISDLQSGRRVLVLWPDHNRTYAQELESFIERRARLEKTYPDLEMRVYSLNPKLLAPLEE